MLLALGIMLLALPTAVFAILSGLQLVLLPYPLFLVLERLPILFPLHMVASGLALILIPAAFLTRRRARLHRVVGRLAAGCVVLGGGTALVVAVVSVASLAVRAGFFVQGLVWLGLLATAVFAIRRGEHVRHARLMIAMACVTSGALWLRLVLVAASFAGAPFETVYAVTAWACWLVPLAIGVTAMSRQPCKSVAKVQGRDYFA